jgi:hypothetical protein
MTEQHLIAPCMARLLPAAQVTVTTGYAVPANAELIEATA